MWQQNAHSENTQNVLPALLPKLVGEVLYFSLGNLAGNLAGILQDFLPTKFRFKKFGGYSRSIFCKKNRNSKKQIMQNFALQTCHLNKT